MNNETKWAKAAQEALDKLTKLETLYLELEERCDWLEVQREIAIRERDDASNETREVLELHHKR